MVDEKLVKEVMRTLFRTYPENDPRARARRFFPLYARIGYYLTGIAFLSGAVFLATHTFPFYGPVCILFGMAAIPSLGIGVLFVSKALYRITVMLMRWKDRIFGRPPKTIDKDAKSD